MARIVPPFGFEFRMRKMVLWKRKDFSWEARLKSWLRSVEVSKVRLRKITI
jgi:hypothetical protein